MPRTIRRAPRLTSLRGARLGFLFNQKTNNEALMDALAAAIGERAALAAAPKWRKSSVYRAAPQRMQKEILESCDALVAGPGD